jgi:hypothetical protein
MIPDKRRSNLIDELPAISSRLFTTHNGSAWAGRHRLTKLPSVERPTSPKVKVPCAVQHAGRESNK